MQKHAYTERVHLCVCVVLLCPVESAGWCELLTKHLHRESDEHKSGGLFAPLRAFVTDKWRVRTHTHGAIVYTKGWMGRDGERDGKRALEWLWLWSASRRWWNGLATTLTAAKCIIVNKIEYSLHRGNNNFSLKQEKKLYLFKENANKRYCSIFF